VSWFTLSLCSVSALAFAELTQQRLLRDSPRLNERTSAVMTFLLQALLSLAAVAALGLTPRLLLPLQSNILPWLAAAALISSFAMTFYLRSFKVQSISVSCIFISWSAAVSAILGIICFSESAGGAKIAGVLAVLLAIAALNFRNAHLEPNHLYGLLGGALFGVTYVLDKKIVLATHPVTYMVWAFLLVALCGALQDSRGTLRALKLVTRRDLAAVAASGLGYFVYNFCTFSAYAAGGEVGRVDAINNSQVFLIISVEYLLYRQRTGVTRKVLCALLAFLGLLLLQMGR
jgi:drug/metabolite transporter (DMT)-like permease